LSCARRDDQLLGGSIKRWTAGPTTGIGPHSGDQVAVQRSSVSGLTKKHD